MKSRAARYVLSMFLASLILSLPPFSPLPADAQNAGRSGDDGQQRAERDRENGDGERGGGFSRRSGGSWQRNRGMGRSRGRDRNDDDEGGDRDNAGRRRGENGDRGDQGDRSQSSDPPSARAAGGASASTSLSPESYARGLIRKYDKNGDNMLQADEQEGLNPTNKSADLNTDGVITADELVTKLSGNVSAPSPAPASKSDDKASETPQADAEDDEERAREDRGDRGRDRDRDKDGERDKLGDSKAAGSNSGSGVRRVYTGSSGSGKSKEPTGPPRTYRFTPATERLPSDLASSFKSRDRNGDGQIAMSEFSRTWSKRTVADFRRHDLNSDGIITPKEAMKSGWR